MEASDRNGMPTYSFSIQRNIHLLWKVIQKRIYSFLNTNVGLAFSLIFFLIACYMVSLFGGDSGEEVKCDHCADYRNNIGDVDSKSWFVHEPIDVVYTWVNGSDPVWLKKKNHWTDIYLGVHHRNSTDTLIPISLDAAILTNSSIRNSSDLYSFNSSIISNATAAEVEPQDDTMSNNRYRDSEELRYSLRSLIKNAPWIRKIFLVTDNQLPYWLNLENGDKLTVVSHYELFENKSVLPVFSSPAIETQLHKIPGLSQRFIYFNDDVFLGSPVYPDDFVSLQGAQKFYMAWEVPKCAPGCSDNWIGDGVCDKVCNVSACNFDFPDCVNSTSSGSSHINTGNSQNAVMCVKQCPDSWLADKVCDQRCRTPECAYDIGDCGLDLVKNNFRSVYLSELNTAVKYGPEFQYPFDETQNSQAATSTDAQNNLISNNSFVNTSETLSSPIVDQTPALPIIPIALRVKIGSNAAFFNSSFLPCKSTNDPEVCNSIERAGFVYTVAEHFDDKAVIHTAVMLSKHHALVFLLYHGQEDAPPSPELPHLVKFIIGGYNSVTNKTVSAEFFLQVDPAKKSNATPPANPDNMGPIFGYIASCWDKKESETRAWANESSPYASNSLQLLQQPFRYLADSSVSNASLQNQGDGAIIEGVSIRLNLNFTDDLSGHRLADYSTFVISTEANDQTMISEWNFVDTVGEMSNQTGLMSSMYGSVANSKDLTFGDLFTILKNEAFKEDDEEDPSEVARFAFLTILVPTRRRWNDIDANTSSGSFTWVHSKVVVAKRALGSTIALSKFGGDSPTWLSINCIDENEPPSRQQSVDSINSDNNTLAQNSLHCDTDSAIKNKLSKSINDESTIICALVSFKWGNKSSITIDHSNTETPTTNRKLFTTMPSQFSDQKSTEFEHKDVDMLHNLDTEDRIISKNMAIRSSSIDQSLKKKQLEIESDFDYEKSWRRWQRRLKISTNPIPSGNSHHATEDYGDERGQGSELHANADAPSSWIVSVFRRVYNLLIEGGRDSRASKKGLGDRPSRRLTDTYAASLVHVNRIYSKDFGYEARKVPAHMPHMIDRTVMMELQSRYSSQFSQTSANRFRSPTDMQYSFSYYYFAMNRNKANPPDLHKYIRDEVDSNKDGVIDDNEFRTVASIVYGKSPSASDIDILHNCSNTSTSSQTDYQESVTHTTDFGNLRKSFSVRIFPTIPELVNCSIIATGLRSNVDWARYRPTHSLGVESQIAFEMVGDNYTETIKQLDSVRQRQSKFICINDNMKKPTVEVVGALKSFYESFFPYQCKFELPPGIHNPTLYVDEYREIQSGIKSIANWSTRWNKLMHKLQAYKIVANEYFSFLIKHAIRILQSIVSDESEQDITVVISNTRRDFLQNPPSSTSKTVSSQRTYFGVFTLMLSAIGLVFIFCLRFSQHRSSRQVSDRDLDENRDRSSRGRFKKEKMSRSRIDDNDDSDRGGNDSDGDGDDSLGGLGVVNEKSNGFTPLADGTNGSSTASPSSPPPSQHSHSTFPRSSIKKVHFGENLVIPPPNRHDSDSGDAASGDNSDDISALRDMNSNSNNKKKGWYPGKYWKKVTK